MEGVGCSLELASFEDSRVDLLLQHYDLPRKRRDEFRSDVIDFGFNRVLKLPGTGRKTRLPAPPHRSAAFRELEFLLPELYGAIAGTIALARTDTCNRVVGQDLRRDAALGHP